VQSVEPESGPPASGVTRTRCEKCQKFARLLPGDTKCSGCSGLLALEFGDITTPMRAVERGGY
jgi:hypothetical protein